MVELAVPPIAKYAGVRGADGRLLKFYNKNVKMSHSHYYIPGFLTRRIVEQLGITAPISDFIADTGTIAWQNEQKIHVSVDSETLQTWQKEKNSALHAEYQARLKQAQPNTHAKITADYQARLVTQEHLRAINASYQRQDKSCQFSISSHKIRALANSANIIINQNYLPREFYIELIQLTEIGLNLHTKNKMESLTTRLSMSSLGQEKLANYSAHPNKVGFPDNSTLDTILNQPLNELLCHVVHVQEAILFVEEKKLDLSGKLIQCSQMRTGNLDTATPISIASFAPLVFDIHALTVKAIQKQIDTNKIQSQIESMYQTLFSAACRMHVKEIVIPKIPMGKFDKLCKQSMAIYQQIQKLHYQVLLAVLQDPIYSNRFKRIYCYSDNSEMLAGIFKQSKLVQLINTCPKLYATSLATLNRRVLLANPSSPDVLLGLVSPGGCFLSEQVNTSNEYTQTNDLAATSTICFGGKGSSAAFKAKQIRSCQFAMKVTASIEQLQQYIQLIYKEYDPSSYTFCISNWISEFRKLDFSSKLIAAKETIDALQRLEENELFQAPALTALQQGRLSVIIREINSRFDSLSFENMLPTTRVVGEYKENKDFYIADNRNRKLK